MDSESRLLSKYAVFFPKLLRLCLLVCGLHDFSNRVYRGYARDLISALDDSVQFLMGGRYDWTEDGSGIATVNSATAAEAEFTSALDKAFSLHLGFTFQTVIWLSLYDNYTTSFGANNTLELATGHEAAPQKGLHREGDAKDEFFARRLLAAVAFYDIRKTNVPVAVLGTEGALFSTISGAVESKGAELDVTGRSNDNWSLIANLSHDDVRVTQGLPFNPADPSDRLSEIPIAASLRPFQS